MRFWPWKRNDKPDTKSICEWPLSAPLFYVSQWDAITLGDALENIWIFGGTGSGKTSTSGYLITSQMLRQGFSGLVLPVKSDEKVRWQQLMRDAGREDDLVIFGGTEPGHHEFNFLSHLVDQYGQFSGSTENILMVIEEVQEVMNRASGQKQSKGDEHFWVLARRELLRNVLDLLIFATGQVSFEHVTEVIRDAPRSRDEAESPEWQSRSVIPTLIRKARANVGDGPSGHDLQQVENFFRYSFAQLAEKTRSVVETSLLSLLDLFVRGKLHRLFGRHTTVTPDEIIEQGKVILIDTPVKSDHGLGLIAQTIWKRFFQKSLERRLDPNRRPAFIVMDECQETITTQDQRFASTSRSSRCVNLFMTQSMTNIAAAFGADEGGKAIADALMGLGQVRIFHQNSDHTTNQAVSDLIGRRKQRLRTMSLQQQSSDYMAWIRPEPSTSMSTSEHWEYALQPYVFTTFSKPSPPDFLAEAVIYHGGRRFRASGENYLRTHFRRGY